MSESEFETAEGFVSADTDPSSAFASRRHLLPQGEKEEGAACWGVDCFAEPVIRRAFARPVGSQ